MTTPAWSSARAPDPQAEQRRRIKGSAAICNFVEGVRTEIQSPDQPEVDVLGRRHLVHQAKRKRRGHVDACDIREGLRIVRRIDGGFH